jgi:hypothetical protein
MQPGVLLIISLLAWYLAVMLIFWYGLKEQPPKRLQVMEIPFTLKEGQTILGIEDTVQGIDFYIGTYREGRKYYDY